MPNYIAILGSTHLSSERNKTIALKAGKEIAHLGFSLAAGNLSGTPEYAFKGAKQNHGVTLSIIEQTQHVFEHPFCDILEIVPSVSTKHKMLCELCCGAVAIGNTPDIVELVELFLGQEKPVVIIENTSKLNNMEVQQTLRQSMVKHYPNLDAAIHKQIKFWPISLQNYN